VEQIDRSYENENGGWGGNIGATEGDGGRVYLDEVKTGVIWGGERG